MKAPTTTLCVCDIYAEWCGPCVSLNKRLANLSGDYIEYVQELLSTARAHARSHALTPTSRVCCLPSAVLRYDPCAIPATILNGAR